MAMTPAERQQRRRARIKQEQKVADDEARVVNVHSFVEFLSSDEVQDVIGMIEEAFDSVDMDMPPIKDEEYPHFCNGWDNIVFNSALDKAKYIVEILRGSAQMLAELINKFQIDQLKQELDECLYAKAATTSEEVLNLLTRVTKAQKQIELLQKETRLPFKAIAIKGGKAV